MDVQRLKRVIPYFVGATCGCVATFIVYTSITTFIPSDSSPRGLSTNVDQAVVDAATLETPVLIEGATQQPSPLDALFEHDSKFTQLESLYKLIGNKDEQQLLDLARQATHRTDRGERNLVQESVFMRLSSINPQRSLELVNEFSNRDHDHMIRAIFNEWFHSDLDSAIAHAATLSETSRLLIMHELVRCQLNLSRDSEHEMAIRLGVESHYITWAVARQDLAYIADPKSRWQSAVANMESDSSETPWIELGRIAQTWVRQQGIGVIREIASSLDDADLRRRVVRSTLKESVGIDPEGVLALAQTLPGINNESNFHNVLAAWTRISPQDALRFASSYHESGTRRMYQERVLLVWGRKDPQGFLDQLDSIPKELRDWAQRQALETLVYRDPEATATLLKNVDDSNTKLRISRVLAREWSNLDVHAALDWLLSDEELASDLRSIGTALQQLAKTDPKLALEKALDQSIDAGSVGPETFVMASVSAANIDEAISMLPSLRENAKPLSHKFIAYYLLRNGETDQALEFGGSIPESYRKDYFVYLFGQWRQSNYHSLLDGLEQFPTDDIKYYAAKVLESENQRSGFLSDKQLRAVESILESMSIDGITGSQLGMSILPPHSFLGVQGR